MNVEEMLKGAVIELEVKCNGKAINFQSKIAFIAGNTVLIDGIQVDQQTIGFNDTCSINFLYKENGKVYVWSDITAILVKYRGNIYHKIDLYGSGKSYNRREAYRLYLGENMFIYINTVKGQTSLSVLIKDISETGVGFITKEELDVNRTFRLQIKDSSSLISLSGRIVRKVKLDQLDSFLYGGKFIEKTPGLSKFIARRQGEQLKGKSQIFSTSVHRDVAMR